MFSLVCDRFYLLFTIFFSDAAAYSDHSYLVEIVVERSIFECNIQNFVKFIKREQHSWRSVTFGKDAGF